MMQGGYTKKTSASAARRRRLELQRLKSASLDLRPPGFRPETAKKTRVSDSVSDLGSLKRPAPTSSASSSSSLDDEALASTKIVPRLGHGAVSMIGTFDS